MWHLKDGLGYFQDAALAPQVSIPTVFHQLHCLYTLRRAYYAETNNDSDPVLLQAFDFGRDRRRHVAHCFDYLLQGLTCAADTAIEPAVPDDDGSEHEFLGSGVSRQCRDFEALKAFVEERRVFDASGFLAKGTDHGSVDVMTTSGVMAEK